MRLIGRRRWGVAGEAIIGQGSRLSHRMNDPGNYGSCCGGSGRLTVVLSPAHITAAVPAVRLTNRNQPGREDARVPGTLPSVRQSAARHSPALGITHQP